MICCVTLSEFLVKALNLPSVLRFLPEGMSAIVAVYVLFAGMRDRFRLVAPKYWVAFGTMTIVIVCGALNNHTDVGPLLSGMRFHLRAIPLFLLPAVLPLSNAQIQRQLRWLLGIALLQVPVALYQRWVIEAEGRFSGDDVRGTLMDSGILSLFLICGVLILTGMLLRGRIRRLWYWVLFFTLLIPTTINETKVTVIFLPVGLFATLLLAVERGKKLKYLGMATAALIVAGAIFVPIYNFTQQHNPYKNERDITAFFSDQKKLAKYLSSDVGGVGTQKDVRRGDAIVVPFEYLAQEPVRLAFGLGIGAVSPSTFGKNFEGPYYLLFQKFLIISFTTFLLEFGVCGILVIGVLFWMVFRDTLKVMREDTSIVGALAAGWSGVVVIYVIDVAYTIFHQFTSVTYLYGYLSGVICARCMSLAYARRRHVDLPAAARVAAVAVPARPSLEAGYRGRR